MTHSEHSGRTKPSPRRRVLWCGLWYGLVGAALLAALSTPAFGDAWGTDRDGNLYRVMTRRKEIAKHGQVRVGAALPSPDAHRPDEGGSATEEREPRDVEPTSEGESPNSEGATSDDGVTGSRRGATGSRLRRLQGTVPTLTDLALSPLKGMYGISYSSLYKINLENPGRSRRIGDFGDISLNACAFDGENRLWAAGGSMLYRIDLETGRATKVGSTGLGGSSDGDLAWIGTNLYATIGMSSGSVLATLDPKTGKATATLALKDELGRALSGVWGLSWDGRALWALSSVGRVYRVDRETGVLTYLMTAPMGFYGACPMLRL